MNETLLSVKDLTLAFEGRPVVTDLTFSVEEGDYLSVVGENGSGKSTLLRAIVGEVRPVSGSLTRSGRLRETGIGYLPQQSKIQQDFPACVREVVRSGCVRRDRLGFLWSRSSRETAEEAMRFLSVADLADRSFGELSGGQRQRVLLARALCASPLLLLLDEPVTGLDSEAAHGMYETIRTVNRERGCAVVMVTHDVSCALRESAHVLSLCRGHCFWGTVAEYERHEARDAAEDEHLHHHGEGEAE